MKQCVAILILVTAFFFAIADTQAYEFRPRISLALSEEYNDNIFLTRDRETDFITRVSPALDLSLRSMSSEIKLAYSPTFSFYTSHDDQNNTAHNLTGGGHFTLSERLTADIAESFVKSSEVTDLRSIQVIGPLFQRTEQRVNILSGTITYRIKANLLSTAAVAYTIVDGSAPDFSDLRQYSGALGLTYIESERDSFSVNARYTKYDYKPGTDSTGQEYTLGITHKFTQTVSLAGTGGISITRFQDSTGTQLGFIGGIDLTKLFSQGSAVLSVRQGITPGTGSTEIVGGTLLKTQTLSLSFTRPVTVALSGTVGATFTRYRSIGSSEEKVDSINVGANLSYRLGKRVDLMLSYNYNDTKDKIHSSNSYTNNTVLLGLRAHYEAPL